MTERMNFDSDSTALDVLRKEGVTEWANGHLRQERGRVLSESAVAAMEYLIDEWDFAGLAPAPDQRRTHGTCRSCGSSFDGAVIPAKSRYLYSPPFRWDNRLGLSDGDGTFAYMCTACGDVVVNGKHAEPDSFVRFDAVRKAKNLDITIDPETWEIKEAPQWLHDLKAQHAKAPKPST